VPQERRSEEVERQLAEPLTVRERSFLRIDPLHYAAKGHCQALIIQGGSDLTVPPRSPELLAAAMRSAGNSDVSVCIFPGVSHSLPPDPIGLSTGWVALPALLTTPEILSTLAEWARLHVQS